MTPIDPFERHLPSALTDLAAPYAPDYLTDILGRTAATRQRPAWASLERWLPMQLATSRVPTTRAPWRQLVVLAVLAALLAMMLAVYVGTRTPHVPAPFGPAENGRLVYSADGDIVIRDALQDAPRVLLGGPTDDHDPGYSPDGTRLLYLSNEGDDAYLMSASADGTGGIRILDDPIVDNAHVVWAPDSKRVAVVNAPRGIPLLSIVAVDGSGSRPITLTGLRPTDILWRPPDGHELLVRAIKPAEFRADQSRYSPIQFYIVDVDGSSPGTVRSVGVDPHDLFGPDWDNSGPEWSLDGNTIFYNVVDPAPGDPGGRYRIHRVNVDGSDDRVMPAPAAEVNEAWPIRSPDGRWLLVEHFTWPDQSDPHLTLAVLPADGSGPAHEVGPRVDDGKDVDRAWSPDGTRILARTGEATMISIDPVSGSYEETGWSSTAFPDWQRRAP
jgi:WD40 repeat protein